MRETCPTCGSDVEVVSSSEGTSHYRAKTAEQLAKMIAPLAAELRQAREENARLRARIREMQSEPRRPS